MFFSLWLKIILSHTIFRAFIHLNNLQIETLFNVIQINTLSFVLLCCHTIIFFLLPSSYQLKNLKNSQMMTGADNVLCCDYPVHQTPQSGKRSRQSTVVCSLISYVEWCTHSGVVYKEVNLFGGSRFLIWVNHMPIKYLLQKPQKMIYLPWTRVAWNGFDSMTKPHRLVCHELCPLPINTVIRTCHPCNVAAFKDERKLIFYRHTVVEYHILNICETSWDFEY